MQRANQRRMSWQRFELDTVVNYSGANVPAPGELDHHAPSTPLGVHAARAIEVPLNFGQLVGHKAVIKLQQCKDLSGHTRMIITVHEGLRTQEFRKRQFAGR